MMKVSLKILKFSKQKTVFRRKNKQLELVLLKAQIDSLKQHHPSEKNTLLHLNKVQVDHQRNLWRHSVRKEESIGI